MKYRNKGLIQIAVSIPFIFIALLALIWALTSTNVTAGFCESEFYQMKEKCNEPYIAFFLCIVSTASSYILLLFGVKNIKLSFKAT